MGGGEEPAGLPGAARPAPGTMSACPFVPCFVITPAAHPLLFSARKKKGGAGRPRARPKNFENFREVLLMQDFQILNMGWLKFKHDYARLKENYARKNLNYPICNASDGYVPRTSW